MIIHVVVLVTLAWLPQTTLSFSFTKKPEQPMVIVLNNNSTNVVFRWEFTLATGDIFSYLNLKRYEKDKGLDSYVTLGFHQPGYTNVNITLYSLDTNVSNGPSSGYVSFTIKDIMKQTNNKDGSTADARSIDYVYRLEMKMANILDAAVSDVEMRLLVQVHNFIGPKNETVNQSEQFRVFCSADGKPTPSLTVVLPNGVEIKGNKILDVNITAYRNMTGMYNCTAENEVTSAQTKTAWLNVWFPASCVMSQVNVTEENSVTLNISTEGNPSVTDYICTHPNGTRLVSNGVLTFIARRRDAGTYHCSVYNGVGNRGNCTGYVNVQFPASCVMSQVNVTEENSVTLNISTKGNPSVTDYICTHPNGTRLVGNGVLTFIARRRDAGTYHCSVYNGVGNRGNCTGYVNVQYKPGNIQIWLNQSRAKDENGTIDIVVNEYDRFNLTCQSDANPTARYEWTVPDPSLFNQGNSQTLIFDRVTTNHAGVYICTAINRLGSTNSSYVNLNVNYKPRNIQIWLNQSRAKEENGTIDIVFNEYDRFNLTCKSDANPTARYEWTVPDPSLFNQVNIQKLEFKRLTPNHAGVYICAAINRLGSTNSSYVNLSVNYKPGNIQIWLNQSRAKEENGTINIDVNEYDSFNLTCQSDANPAAQYEWTLPDLSLFNQGNSQTLIFDRVTTNYAGVYICTAINKVGSTNSSYINLSVNYKPRNIQIWLNQSRAKEENGTIDIVVNEYDRFNLTCQSDANPTARYEWTVPDPGLFNQVNNQKLEFKRVTPNHAGGYICVAINKVGSTNSSYVNLSVNYGPLNRTYCSQHPTSVHEGENVTLNCEAETTPPSNFAWVYRTRTMENQSRFLFGVNSSLHNREYVCRACNPLGCGTCKVFLDVTYGPKEPLNCSNHLRVIEGHNATIYCIASANPAAKYLILQNDKIISNVSKVYLSYVTRKINGSVITCNASNNFGSAICENPVTVSYIDSPKFPCYDTAVVSRDKETFTLNMTVDAHPDAEASCYSTSKNASLQKISKVGSITSFSLTITENDTTTYTCLVKNEIDTKSKDLQVYQTRPSRWIEGHFKILNLTLADVNVSQLNGTVTNMLENIYRCVSYVNKVYVERFSSGSVVVDFKVLGIADINTTEYLKPFKDAVSQNSLFPGGLQIDYTSIKSGYSPVTSTTTSPSSTATPAITRPNQPSEKPEVPVWIIVVVAVVAVVLIFLVFVAIVCYRKIKRRKKEKEDKTRVIPTDDNLSARNGQGISPSSDYPGYGPSHTNPTFDHSVITPKSNTNNSNQTKSEKEEPSYAAVDYTKKKKYNNPEEELSYAKLEDLQNKNTQPKGSHDGIVLELQPKGKNTKMPEKHQETIYADIVGTKKQGDGNQGDGAKDASLNDLHKKDDETAKEKQPSDGNLGTTEEKEQKTVVKEKGDAIKPPVNQQVQPPTKEDTGADACQVH